MATTRFAPSPTGRLHLGHAYSAVQGHRLARENGGRFLLRIEDLDSGRCRTEYVQGIFEDMAWLGLGHHGEVLVQSRRTVAYEEALERLRWMGLAYPCFCTRADIAEALSAPHGNHGGGYPGTCRDLPDNPERRARTAHSWRLDTEKAVAIAGLPEWTEADGAHFRADRGDIDDAVLARKDAPASYHLACVVDDAEAGVTTVARGIDLRSSTPIQRLLQSLLDLPEPQYLHHRLVTHEDGRRLAKRDLAPTLAAMRDAGVDGRELADALAKDELPLGFRLSGA